MRALVLTPDVQKSLKAAISHALLYPVSLKMMEDNSAAISKSDDGNLWLKDRPKDLDDHVTPVNEIKIPHGFTVCVSCEMQPIGFCAHFSVSVDSNNPEAMPNVTAVEAILAMCNIDIKKDCKAMWTEQFIRKGGGTGLALNLLFKIDELNWKLE